MRIENDQVDRLIALGASAGGLDALLKFFGALPVNTGHAFVVVQHLSGEHKSLMVELLSRHTEMLVRRIEDGMSLCPNEVYLAPAQCDVSLEPDNMLSVTGRRPGGLHLPINHFFKSAAAARGTSSTAIVLSGTGSDGSEGLLSMHQAGGQCLVQAPDSATFDGMPVSAVATGIVDQVLAPEELASLVASSDNVSPGAEQPAELPFLLEQIQKVTGQDFSYYKYGTLIRRLQRRAKGIGRDSLREYISEVLTSPEELREVAQDFLVGVTQFYRDPEVFAALDAGALGEALTSAEGEREPRLWSIACSTGEEAYTLAMLCEEHRRRAGGRRARVIATDCDPRAIDIASRGRYDTESAALLPTALRERYLVPEGDHFMVCKPLRQSIIFSVHNALVDPPFARIDLVSCRNLMIYLTPEAQSRLLTRVHFSLKGAGLLLLGKSETTASAEQLFEAEDAEHKLFRALPVAVKIPAPNGRTSPELGSRTRGNHLRPVEEACSQILASRNSAAVLVNAGNQVMRAFGDVSPYLRFATGELSLGLVELAPPGASGVLSAALGKARREECSVTCGQVEFARGTGSFRAKINVEPVGAQKHALVTFQSVFPTPEADSDLPGGQEFVAELQSELRLTQQTLQATIEELESANEDLQATNEELFASNEELQATNEELQATNEELHSANDENERRISELVRLHADVDSLLDNSQIGTIFLDRELRVRKFTQSTSAWVHLLPGDVGRPLSYLTHDLDDFDLVAGARQACEGFAGEHQVTSGDRTALLRLVPYQLHDRVEGVVITFTEVTLLKRAEQRLQSIIDSIPVQLAVVDSAGTITATNRAWTEFAEKNGANGHNCGAGLNYLAVTRPAAEDGDKSAAAAAAGLQRVLQGGATQFTLVEYPCHSPDERRFFQMSVNAFEGGEGAVVGHFDISQRVLAERRSLERFVEVVNSSPDPKVFVKRQTMEVVRVNAAFHAFSGIAVADAVGKSLADVLPALRDSVFTEGLQELDQGQISVRLERLQFPSASGPDVPTTVHVSAVGFGSEEWLLLDIRDASERLKADQDQVMLRARLTQAQKMEAIGNLAGGVAHELNNVLSAIVGVVGAWEGETDTAVNWQSDVESVLSACKRGKDLTSNLLSFSRRSSVIREEVPLESVVHEVYALLKKNVKPGVNFHFVVPDESVVVSGDRSQIAQALMNLCLNAFAAVEKSGTVRINLSRDVASFSPAQPQGPPSGTRPAIKNPTMALLSVTDDGCGMDRDTLAQAFEPYFTTKSRTTGSGLGLTMVFGVARAHGGWVDVDSVEGRGTEVILSMPVASEAVNLHRGSVAPPAGRRVVLLVDDDGLARRGMERLLTRYGHAVLSVEDGQKAVDVIRDDNQRIDIAVVDLVMPNMDGLEILERIRSRRPELPVVIYSGYADVATGTRFQRDSLTDFVSKPVDPIAFRSVLENLSAPAPEMDVAGERGHQN